MPVSIAVRSKLDRYMLFSLIEDVFFSCLLGRLLAVVLFACGLAVVLLQ